MFDSIRLCTLFSVICVIVCNANQDSISQDLVNSKVQRTVDLTTHLPQITNTITLENNGKSSIRMFLYAVDRALSDKLSFIGASVSKCKLLFSFEKDKWEGLILYSLSPKG